MKKIVLIWALTAAVMASVGCAGAHDVNYDVNQAQAEMPREQFDPEEAFLEIPHDSFKSVWLNGGMTSQDSEPPVYEETYDFVLSMEKAVIPYTVTGKVKQTCEYSPSKERWKVERSLEEVSQEMDLSRYLWVQDESMYGYIQSFVKTGPNTFASGEPEQPTEPYFTVDILSGGAKLKDEEGQTNLPGGQWAARLYIEYPGFTSFKKEAAIDLVGGSFGYNDSQWIVPMSELKRVEKEENMTDEDRIREDQEVFQKTFPSASSFEIMDPELAVKCCRELALADFGNVGVEKAAAAKNSWGQTIGWVVQAYSRDAYGGDVIIAVAFDREGSIEGLEFLLLEDTPGLGMRAADDEFKNQFIGKHSKSLSVAESDHAGEAEINAISGATTTSNAVTNAVNGALYYVENFAEPAQ